MKTILQHFKDVKDEDLREKLLYNLMTHGKNRNVQNNAHKTLEEAFSIFDSISKVKELEHEVVQLKAQLIDIKRKTSELMTLVA